MDLNKAMLIGRLTRDVEVRTTPQGTNVASFSVATNFSWKDATGNRQDRPEYHDIVAWRKLADICGQYLRKGSKIYIEGRMQTRSWEDQQGNKKYKTEIIADNMIMLDSKGGSSDGAPFTPSAPRKVEGNPNSTQASQAPVPPPADDEIRIEDIPF